MRKLLIILVLLMFSSWVSAQDEEDKKELTFPIINYVMKADRNETPSVDHKKFDELKKEFADAHEVTATCLECHTGRGMEVMATSHWKWQREEEIEGKGAVPLGKKNILNNFCVGVSGSEGTCTRCHIGYGWADKSLDVVNPNNIDCAGLFP